MTVARIELPGEEQSADRFEGGDSLDFHRPACHHRWLFYPPEVLPPGIRVAKSGSGDLDVQSPNPVQWLLEVRPELL